MMEERYHATTQNRFYPDMSNVNKNIRVEAKLTSPPHVSIPLSETFVILTITERYIIYKYVMVSSKVHIYSCQILMKIEFSWHIFEKYSNIKLHEYASSDSGVVPCGNTDGQTDVTELVVTFRSFANAR